MRRYLLAAMLALACAASLGVAAPAANATLYTCPAATPAVACSDANTNFAVYASSRGLCIYFSPGSCDRPYYRSYYAEWYCWRNSAWTDNNLRARCDHTYFFSRDGAPRSRWIHLQLNIRLGAPSYVYPSCTNGPTTWILNPWQWPDGNGNNFPSPGYICPRPNGSINPVYYTIERYGKIDETGGSG